MMIFTRTHGRLCKQKGKPEDKNPSNIPFTNDYLGYEECKKVMQDILL